MGGSRKGRGYGELGMVAGGIRRWQMRVVEGGNGRRQAGCTVAGGRGWWPVGLGCCERRLAGEGGGGPGWAVAGEGGGWGVCGRVLTMASRRRWWRSGVDFNTF